MNAVLYDELPAMHRADALTGLVEGLLEKNPEQRTGAAETARILTAVLHGAPHIQVPLSRPRPPDGFTPNGWPKQHEAA